MGALVVVVSCLSRSGHQPGGTNTLRKHLIVFVEGINGGLEEMTRTVFKAANRITASVSEALTVASVAR